MFGLSGEEGCRFAIHPGSKAGPVKRGERMIALTARQLEIAPVFMARRHGEPFRSSERSVLHAWHVVVARQLDRRKIDESRKDRDRAGQRMADVSRMRRTPAASGEIPAAPRQ